MGTWRTLLALSVLLGHLGFERALVGGRNAVQLFYMISGFLISYVLATTPAYSSSSRFYSNRALRLFPIYWVVAALALATALFRGEAPTPPFLDLSASAKWLLAASNALLFGQDWLFFLKNCETGLCFTKSFRSGNPVLIDFLLVPQAWTLGLELTFYLLAPFVLRRLPLLVALFLASIALRLVGSAFGLGGGDPWRYRFFPYELSLFLAGALSHRLLLPWAKDVVARRPFRDLQVFLVIVVLLIVFPLIPGASSTKRLVLFAVFFVALPFGFLHQASRRHDAAIGDLSYPLYICHLLVIGWSAAYFTGHNHIAVSLVGALLMSFALNMIVARPVDRLRHMLRN
ncbi:MAG: acyltransferase [Hyphomicrobiaceae bacterium]|nr:MAG: acyltransferase [Hyphomicrobiaceae bacterium]